MADDVVIRAEGLGKRYRLAPAAQAALDPDAVPTTRWSRFKARTAAHRFGDEFWALRDITFEIKRGDIVGAVGANGAGKSTLLKLLARVAEPTEGYAELRGRVGSLLEVGTGFHGDLSGRDNVFLNGGILGMRRAEIYQRFDEIVEFSGIGRFIDVPVKYYSSGMYVRLAFAVAAYLDPEILLVDEVLSVGDQAFQDKCLGRIDEVTRGGRTVIFVSHNMNSVTTLCNRGFLLEAGRITFEGSIEKTVETYLGRRERLKGGGVLGDVKRDGDGQLRFREVRVTNDEGGHELFANRPVHITLVFEGDARIPGRQLNIGLGINTPLGDRLITLYTRFDPDQELARHAIDDSSVLTCIVPELPLRPGPYLLTLYMDRTGELVDRVQNQIEFYVLPSNFFGTGQLPTESQGAVMVRHRWAVDVPSDMAAPAIVGER